MDSPSKRLEKARQAFSRRDRQASALAHEPAAIVAAAERHGGAGGQYLGEMVYGGLDGIITTFAVVSGVAGAQLGTPVILILGLANLFADGFSMATGAYLSTKSKQEYYRKEWEREAWEVWELWRSLDAHLDRLPRELRAPLADWEMRGGDSGRERGLWRLDCPRCGRESWLPAEAVRCPACRAAAGLRRTG